MPASPSIHPTTPNALRDAAAILRQGGLVAFPTETVYGLGADAGNDRAVAAIFAAKDRPSFNPLIVHCLNAEAASRLVCFDDRATLVAEQFWPGALTLVLPRRADCPLSLLIGAGLETVAVRVPDHPVALALLKESGLPIAAPSANRSGEVSPTTAAHVAQSLGARVPLILDGGPCRVGLESTVIDLTGPRATLLRPGGIPAELLASLLGPLADPLTDAEAPRSPGMLASHYAPHLPLRLDATEARPGEALLGLGPAPTATLNLSPQADLAEAAANLFAMLRTLDRPEFTGIAVMPVPETGLGRAINDRLRRAAAPR